jgi:hypothetical protein
MTVAVHQFLPVQDVARLDQPLAQLHIGAGHESFSFGVSPEQVAKFAPLPKILPPFALKSNL